MNTKCASFVTTIVLGVAYAQAQTGPPAYYFNPHWSLDGTKIVFESTKDGRRMNREPSLLD